MYGRNSTGFHIQLKSKSINFGELQSTNGLEVFRGFEFRSRGKSEGNEH